MTLPDLNNWPTPLLLGHRGAPVLEPENTLAGFAAAVRAGLHGVELDVRRLADGTLVVHHDAALPGGAGLDTLRREAVPGLLTLRRALAWAADTGAYLNIELKFEGVRPDDRVHQTLQAVLAHGLAHKTVLSSFHPGLLRRARALQPTVPRALLTHRAHPPALLRSALRWTGAAALHPPHAAVNRALLRALPGVRLHAWTVNDPVGAARLLELGVHGLIGDDPAALLAALSASRSR